MRGFLHSVGLYDPAIQYVSGGHLSTILKADDYVKVIRDFLGNI